MGCSQLTDIYSFCFFEQQKKKRRILYYFQSIGHIFTESGVTTCMGCLILNSIFVYTSIQFVNTSMQFGQCQKVSGALATTEWDKKDLGENSDFFISGIIWHKDPENH